MMRPPVDHEWRPVPIAYAGWFGHALMRRRGHRLAIVVTDRTMLDLVTWGDVMRKLVDATPGIAVASLHDRAGRDVAGFVSAA